MFHPFAPTEDVPTPIFDMEAMMAVLRGLDAGDLARVEDDLDFYHFTGGLTPRLKRLMAAAQPMRKVA